VNWRPLALVILVIGLVAIVAYYVKKGSSVPEGYQYEERVAGEDAAAPSGEMAQPGATGVETGPPVSPRDVEGLLKEEEETFTYSSKNLRNPMTPLLAKQEAAVARTKDTRRASSASVAHQLIGIIWSATKPLAIIDGNVMGVGEKLRDGSSVAEIGRNFVALKRGGKTFRLVLE